jgi:UDP-N-acetylglucosamine--N-acetylmuramyl-(pentapeptide) pyrophosphoryl-undecaprenol N-acetylglucosamine transferase
VPRVYYGVSPIGLGHATRALVVADGLRAAGVDVRFFTGGKAAEFMKREGVALDDIVSDPTPRVVGGEMKDTALWFLRSWAALRRTLPRTERAMDAYRPDLVVCDEEFSGMVLAVRKGLGRVFISDELELGFARTWLSRRAEARVYRWYKRLQESATLLIVPDFGSDAGNLRHVGPVVRPLTRGKSEVFKDHGLPEGGRMVLLSMSGSGVGGFLAEKVIQALEGAGVPGTFLAVTGNRGARLSGERVYDLGVVRNNQDLVAAADLVISTAGKSTIDEASAAGTPMVAIPIGNHAEQERNAAALGYSRRDSERLASLIKQMTGRREAPKAYNGAEAASGLILSLLAARKPPTP